MKLHALVAAAAAASVLAAPSASGATSHLYPAEIAGPASAVAWTTNPTPTSPPELLKRAAVVSAVASARAATWQCQDAFALPRSGSEPTRTLLSSSDAYRQWALSLWKGRLAGCRALYELPDVNDWTVAVRVAQRAYRGSEWWLMSCSASEGGHGQFEYHGGGYAGSNDVMTEYEPQTPGGWMQYFPGTFWGDFHAAVADLSSRGFRVPRSAASWYSPLGQAIAGGWAYGHDRPVGKWTGSGC